MKHLLILLTLLILTATPSVCQKGCNTFECAYNEAKRLFNDSKSVDRFGRALLNLEGAENLAGNDENNKKKIRELRAKIIEAITGQNRMLKEATEIANLAKENSDRLLKELRETSDQAVLLLLNEIDRNILRLEYDSTFEKCRIALNLKSEKYGQQVKERILEVAYFYTETDTFEAAIKTINLLKINALLNRSDLLATIQKNSSPQYFVFLEERYYPKMLNVEGGEFTMGSDENDMEQPMHRVKINSFKMAETETTVWQYFLYLKSTHQKQRNTPPWQYLGDNPIVYVSWYNAIEYCNWLSNRSGLSSAYDVNKNLKDTNNLNEIDEIKWTTSVAVDLKSYRIPTEAEWEYAAKGGQFQDMFRYSGSNDILEVAWTSINSNNRTHSVKTLKPNTLGIYDMSGNAWEWCFDWVSQKYNVSFDNQWVSPLKGSMRVIRGGAFDFNRSYTDDGRVLTRSSYFADAFYEFHGFRCVQTK